MEGMTLRKEEESRFRPEEGIRMKNATIVENVDISLTIALAEESIDVDRTLEVTLEDVIERDRVQGKFLLNFSRHKKRSRSSSDRKKKSHRKKSESSRSSSIRSERKEDKSPVRRSASNEKKEENK